MTVNDLMIATSIYQRCPVMLEEERVREWVMVLRVGGGEQNEVWEQGKDQGCGEHIEGTMLWWCRWY